MLDFTTAKIFKSPFYTGHYLAVSDTTLEIIQRALANIMRGLLGPGYSTLRDQARKDVGDA